MPVSEPARCPLRPDPLPVIAMPSRQPDRYSDLEGATSPGISRWTILRDLVIFQVKLGLDGLKDVVLSPLSLITAGLAIVFGGRRRGRLFYWVLRIGERFDLWLNLFGAADRRDVDGLFGGSKAGSDTLLGELEQRFRGGDVPRSRRRER